MNRTLLLVVAVIVVVAVATPALTRLLDAATPLAIVVLLAILAWKLVQHYTRP
jgi:hypothetical protein